MDFDTLELVGSTRGCRLRLARRRGGVLGEGACTGKRRRDEQGACAASIAHRHCPRVSAAVFCDWAHAQNASAALVDDVPVHGAKRASNQFCTAKGMPPRVHRRLHGSSTRALKSGANLELLVQQLHRCALVLARATQLPGRPAPLASAKGGPLTSLKKCPMRASALGGRGSPHQGVKAGHATKGLERVGGSGLEPLGSRRRAAQRGGEHAWVNTPVEETGRRPDGAAAQPGRCGPSAAGDRERHGLGGAQAMGIRWSSPSRAPVPSTERLRLSGLARYSAPMEVTCRLASHATETSGISR